MITSVITVITIICWVTYLVSGAVMGTLYSQWIWMGGGSTPSLRWRIWREANLPGSDSEHWCSGMSDLRSYAVSSLLQKDSRRCFRMAFWRCFAGCPEDVVFTTNCPVRALSWEFQWQRWNQDKPLHTLSISEVTLKALWHCPRAGVRGCPHWITFLGIFVINTRPKWSSEINGKKMITTMTTTKITPSIYPTSLHVKNWAKRFISLPFNS